MVDDAARRERAPGLQRVALAWVWTAACVASPPPPAPPPDVDLDGALLGVADRCPELPEDLDGFEDDDGCPDRDNDGDGVLDAHAWDGRAWVNCDGRRSGRRGEVIEDCRDLPEDLDGVEDDDGCPDAFIIDGCALVRVRLDYDPATLTLASETPVILDALAEFIARRPDLRVYLNGHAAPQRRPAGAKALSRRAAERVQAELVRRGGAPLEIRAFGDKVPMAPNDTPEGRRMNTHVDVSWEECRRSMPLCGEVRQLPAWRHPLRPDAE